MCTTAFQAGYIATIINAEEVCTTMQLFCCKNKTVSCGIVAM